jgi:hypothetical protein
MSAEHKQLLWRYRFALTKEKAALTKFLNCVDWTDQEEVAQAVELTGEWERQVSIDINDALQLLSANFTHPKAPALPKSALAPLRDVPCALDPFGPCTLTPPAALKIRCARRLLGAWRARMTQSFSVTFSRQGPNGNTRLTLRSDRSNSSNLLAYPVFNTARVIESAFVCTAGASAPV